MNVPIETQKMTVKLGGGCIHSLISWDRCSNKKSFVLGTDGLGNDIVVKYAWRRDVMGYGAGARDLDRYVLLEDIVRFVVGKFPNCFGQQPMRTLRPKEGHHYIDFFEYTENRHDAIVSLHLIAHTILDKAKVTEGGHDSKRLASMIDKWVYQDAIYCEKSERSGILHGRIFNLKPGAEIPELSIDGPERYILFQSFLFGKIVSASPSNQKSPVLYMQRTRPQLYKDMVDSLGISCGITAKRVRYQVMNVVNEVGPPETEELAPLSPFVNVAWQQKMSDCAADRLMYCWALPAYPLGCDESIMGEEQCMTSVMVAREVLHCALRGLTAALSASLIGPSYDIYAAYSKARGEPSLAAQIINYTSNYTTIQGQSNNPLHQYQYSSPETFTLPHEYLTNPPYATIIITKPTTPVQHWRFDLPHSDTLAHHCQQQLFSVLYRVTLEKFVTPLPPNVILYPHEAVMAPDVILDPIKAIIPPQNGAMIL